VNILTSAYNVYTFITQNNIINKLQKAANVREEDDWREYNMLNWTDLDTNWKGKNKLMAKVKT